MVDPYELLQVPRNASAGQIRSAYRRMLREHHPDLFEPGSPEHRRAVTTTRRVVAARQAIEDLEAERLRAAYDLPAPTVTRLPVHRRQQEDQGPHDEPRVRPTIPTQRRPVAPEAGTASVLRLVRQRYDVPARGTAEHLVVTTLEDLAADATSSTTVAASRALADRAVASVPQARALLPQGTPVERVAALAVAAAYRDLVADGDRRRPQLADLATGATARLWPELPLERSRPVPHLVPGRAREPFSSAMLALACLGAVIWVLAAATIATGSSVATPADGPGTVWTLAAFAVALVGPFWLLSRPGRPDPSRVVLRHEPDVVEDLRARMSAVRPQV